MTECILIPCEQGTAPSRLGLGRLEDFQSAVGGNVEGVYFDEQGMLLFLDEDGKVVGKPRNVRASLLLWWFSPHSYRRDFIVGDAVVAGLTDHRHTSDVPEPFSRWLIDGALFHIEAHGRDCPNSWTDIFGWVDDYYEALMFGLHVREHWGFANDVRIVESNS